MDELSVIEPKVEAFPDTFVRKAGFNVVSPGDVFRAGAPGRDGFAGGRSQPVAIRRQEVVK